MAEDSRPPADEPPALPRRTPGAGSLTPGQVRRGFLSPRTAATAAQATPADAPRTDQTEPSLPPRPARSLPRRSPGTSAIQTPPRTARPLRAAPAPAGNPAGGPARSEPPSPSSLASSAASLLRATAAAELAAVAAAELAAAVAPRRASPETPPASVLSEVPTSPPAENSASIATAEPATSPATTVPSAAARSPTGVVPPPSDSPFPEPTQPAGRRRRVRPARRWQLAGLILAVVVVIGAVSALIAGHQPAKSAAGSASGQAGRQRLASASAVRGQATEWVASQVGHDVSVACDAATCRALAARGFPASNLNVVQPTASDPYGSVLVIATAGIRSQFGSKLEAVYAPQVIASFGAGPARIDIRAIAPLGPAAFGKALAGDLAARKSAGAQLLRNPRITVAAGARQLLADGLIDTRLLTTIAFLAGQQPIEIVGFGGAAPGAAPVPLRSVYLAESDAAAHVTGSAYVQALQSVLHAQTPPYVPLSVASVQLGGGAPVLQVVFAAPSPLGLLHS